MIGDNGNSGAWLANWGFIDFAGSTVVHSVGGWAALAGAMVSARASANTARTERPRAIPGHSLSMATLGVFILALGWFGFNGGSTTAANGTVARIIVNTFLAGCVGAIAAMMAAWFKFGKPDVGMTLNGVLAGLVAITSPCATVTPLGALIIGAVAGVLVVFAVLFFDKIKIDDPVGAVSVHGVCGMWGTLAAALLHENLFLGLDYDLGHQLMVQLTGIAVAFFWTFTTAFILFKVWRPRWDCASRPGRTRRSGYRRTRRQRLPRLRRSSEPVAAFGVSTSQAHAFAPPWPRESRRGGSIFHFNP